MKDDNTSDHDLLIRLDEKMDNILTRLGKSDVCMEDHEKRIGKLESFQSTVLAFVTSITIGVTLAANWVISWLPKGGS